MNVFILSEYYDNCQSYDNNIDGDVILGAYSSYNKAKQAAMEFQPRSFNVSDEAQRVVTEISNNVHMRENVVRELREYVDEYHQYEYELYITEKEMDAPVRVDM